MVWGEKTTGQSLMSNTTHIPTVINTDDMSWMNDNTESILIFGPPKHGKTYGYMSYINNIVEKGGHVYIVSTEGGVPRTLQRYYRDIGKQAEETLKDKVTFRRVYNVDEARAFWLEIKDGVKKEDLFIVDLLSSFYEWLQADFVDYISRGNITSYIMNAMQDPKKFGLMEGSKWNYIKAAHRFVEDIIARKRCNVICVATEKDTEGEKAIGGSKVEGKLRKIYLTDMSVRAGGPKDLPTLFDTLVRIAMVGEGEFACLVVGDRGNKPTGQAVVFGNDLKQYIDKFRGEQK